MKNYKVPDSYIGREQALVKHTILKTYIERLFLIIGQKKETVINYVDCFAGPWQEEDENLRDTSIGISLEKMDACQKALAAAPFNQRVKFRALYIEKDSLAFNKLENFLSQKPFPSIETQCIKGDNTELLPEIVKWCGNHFTFFFVDPMGWQNVVSAKMLRPLLNLPKSEFLINLMYDFINRFITLEQHAEDMIDIFGEVPSFTKETPEQRQQKLLSLYRSNMVKYHKGRTAFVPIYKPGQDRVHYFLVYLTKSPRGIDVFKTEAEKMEIVQRITQREVKLRNQLEKSNNMDLFSQIESPLLTNNLYEDNRHTAKEYLLQRLTKTGIKIDFETWAEFLEDTDLYPTDFQLAMKELVSEGRAINLDSPKNKRIKNIIKPNWFDKAERWALL